jgi:ABC-2 type transport system ATP-binding protein
MRTTGIICDLAAHALARLTGAGIGVSDFALGQPSLDEVFLALTGGQAAPANTRQAPAGMETIR